MSLRRLRTTQWLTLALEHNPNSLIFNNIQETNHNFNEEEYWFLKMKMKLDEAGEFWDIGRKMPIKAAQERAVFYVYPGWRKFSLLQILPTMYADYLYWQQGNGIGNEHCCTGCFCLWPVLGDAHPRQLLALAVGGILFLRDGFLTSEAKAESYSFFLAMCQFLGDQNRVLKIPMNLSIFAQVNIKHKWQYRKQYRHAIP